MKKLSIVALMLLRVALVFGAIGLIAFLFWGLLYLIFY